MPWSSSGASCGACATTAIDPPVGGASRLVRGGISTAISDGVHTILAELGRRGIEPAGPLQVVYHADQVLDEDSVAPIEICFPVAAPLEATGEVYGAELAGGPREVYLSDPGQVEEGDLLTEVQWPIR